MHGWLMIWTTETVFKHSVIEELILTIDNCSKFCWNCVACWGLNRVWYSFDNGLGAPGLGAPGLEGAECLPPGLGDECGLGLVLYVPGR